MQKIDHINIVCDNIDRSVEFYTSVFDFKETARFLLKDEWFEKVTNTPGNKAKCVFLQIPGNDLRIELLEFIEKPERNKNNALFDIGMRHFAIQVEDIEAVREKLIAKNIEFISEPVLVPFSILPQGKKLCYFKAPDNVIVEIAQYGIK